MKSVLRLSRFLKPYLGLVILNLVLMIGLVAADLSIPRLIQTLVDTGIRQHDMAAIVNISLAITGVTVFSAVCTVSSILLVVRISQKTASDIRRKLFVKIQSFSFGNFDHLQPGQLLTRLTSDVSQVGQLILQTLRMFIRAPLMILGSVIMLMMTNWQIALIILALMTLAIIVFMLYANKAQPLFMQVQRKLDRLNTIFQENLSGVRIVKSFVRADHENERFNGANVDLTDRTIKVERMLAFVLPILRLLANLGFVVVVWFGGIKVINGDITIGQIIAMNNYTLWAMFALVNVGMMVSFISSADASAWRIFEVLDSHSEVCDKDHAITLSNVKGRVTFEDVSFAYNGQGQEPVLNHINLVAEPGETVAIVGSTGAGKSTLINLIPRFYDATAGKVMIDGIDVRDITINSLRAHVGVALQDTVLFTGTIRDNIRYGRPDAKDEDIFEAAKSAQAHDFITSFPSGYDTIIGQRGVNLSGGQKQRLAIARALLLKPSILVLDDATSSVDVETEVKIQAALDRFMADRTSFIVAQRISTVMRADKIVVLDRGKIEAVGTHQSLMETSPIYQEIYHSQLGDGKEGESREQSIIQ
jgi:ATP-binding cassette subfamily B multidrug efflux pump